MFRKFVCGLATSVVCAGAAFAAEPDSPPSTLGELQRRIEKVLADTNTPSVGIALLNHEGPYWVAGLGKADTKSGRAADPDTLFRIGSISKMFAAFAVLKLVEEGRLSLDDTLRERAPDVAFENPWEATHPVRIAHLLEHTTGWDDIHIPEYAYAAPDTMTVKQGLDFHPHSRAPRWPPGTRHAYCNSGSAVAAYVVEKVTGERFEDYVAKTFFAPLGMESTSYFRTRLYDERGATLYQGNRAQPYWQIIHRAAGSINSSARDMAKLVHFMLLRGSTPNGPLLAESSIDRMETPATTLGNAVGIQAGYGLANYTSGHRNFNHAFRGHNGGVHGGLSELSYVKELGRGYVFMINSGNGEALGRISGLVRDYLLKDVKPVTTPPAPLPARYKEIDGYYQPINDRNQSMAFMSPLVGILKITHDETVLHRSPMFGGWISSDRVGARGVLVDGWHGLPAIAVVEDPLVGPAVQVGGDLFQRVAAWKVFARLGTPIAMVLVTLAGFVGIAVWAARRKKTNDRRFWLRLWPLVASLALLSFVLTAVIGGGQLQWLGTVSPLSVGLFLLSLVYPAAVLLGGACLLTRGARERLNLPYWFAVAFVFVHVLIAGYLTLHGVIGFRTWA